MSTQIPMGMEHHPDIVELREHYERVTSTPAAQAVEALAVLAGLFLAISPWVVGFNGLAGFGTLVVNNLVLGLAFALLMGGYGSAYERTHARAWAATAIGAWCVIAPWVVSGNVDVRRTITTNAITGGVMLLLGLAAISMASMTASGAAMRRGAAGRATGGRAGGGGA
ncbi:SPW repeat protein [Kitasatospora sp. NBC_00315]|uniref:SPW repeat protein n=1 Tax=Kitasatospora sp. NBC_00315 TaxID=2975963 RepID=UPI003246611E